MLEDFVVSMGTSVASALTAETGFEVNKVIKCMSDVDMRGRVRMWSKFEIFMFFSILATRTIENIRNITILRRRAFLRTCNTLIQPNFASARQSRDSLHRDTHKLVIAMYR